jgi:hypothetical protein
MVHLERFATVARERERICVSGQDLLDEFAVDGRIVNDQDFVFERG